LPSDLLTDNVHESLERLRLANILGRISSQCQLDGVIKLIVGVDGRVLHFRLDDDLGINRHMGNR
jgi:hypothetical protein